MRTINVLHLRDTYEVGGPGKTIIETHRSIDPARFRLHLAALLTRHESGDTPFLAAARECGIPVHVVRGFNQYDPRVISRLARLVKRLGIDVVHAHEVKSDVIAFLSSRLQRVPIITTLHGWIGNSARQRCLAALDRYVVRHFDRVIAVSAHVARELAAGGVRGDKVQLLHNAIVIEHYRRTGKRAFLASLLGHELQRPVIGAIGRLSPEKGHADLVEALGIVAARGCMCSAVLVGDGSERQALVEKIRFLDLGRSVHLVGYVSRAQAALEDIDLMVLPSHTEGLPNAALEALAMEVPVLATNVGGTPEVITDGATGRLVPPHSPVALAEAIMDFASNPASWQAMARRGREMVEAGFSFQTRTRRLEAIYLDLLGEGGP